MTGPGTNTYVVGAGRDHAVIDVAVPDESYLEAIEESAGHVTAILVTHRHPDHVGGVAALAARTGAPVVAFSSAPAGEARVDEPIEDESVVETAGVRLRALHTPGHARDHVCWMLEGTASLFSGDNILGEGTAVISPPDGDMGAYLKSLRRLDEFDIQRIYPGHWRALDGGNEVIRAYLTHRQERQEAILATLKTSPKRPEDIVAEVYADTAPELHRLARQSVIAHLRLLEEEGLVAREGEQWTRLVETYRRGGATE
jgi:glyoxylase-like metal-dependent hydrolase (beta-lactamase superfamily II)